MGKRIFFVRVVCGTAILLVLLWQVDVAGVIEHLKNARLPWVFASALAIIVATFLGATNVHLFVNRDGRLPFRHFLPIYWLAWAMSLVVPGQIGDIASISIMLRRRGMPWHASLGRTLLDKAITFVLMLLLGLGGLLSILAPEDLRLYELLWLLVGLACLGAILYAVRHRIARAGLPYLDRVIELVQRTVRESGEVIRLHSLRVALNMVLTAIRIALIGGSYWCMFVALGSSLNSLLQVVAIVAASSLVAYVPISFNGLGTVELAGIVLFGELGIAGTTVLSAYLALRFLVFALAWIPTALWLLLGGKQAGKTLDQNQP